MQKSAFGEGGGLKVVYLRFEPYFWPFWSILGYFGHFGAFLVKTSYSEGALPGVTLLIGATLPPKRPADTAASAYLRPPGRWRSKYYLSECEASRGRGGSD